MSFTGIGVPQSAQPGSGSGNCPPTLLWEDSFQSNTGADYTITNPSGILGFPGAGGLEIASGQIVTLTPITSLWPGNAENYVFGMDIASINNGLGPAVDFVMFRPNFPGTAASQLAARCGIRGNGTGVNPDIIPEVVDGIGTISAAGANICSFVRALALMGNVPLSSASATLASETFFSDPHGQPLSNWGAIGTQTLLTAPANYQSPPLAQGIPTLKLGGNGVVVVKNFRIWSIDALAF